MNVAVIVEKIRDTRAPFYRPALLEQDSASVHPGILTLMKQSWAEEPSERPSFVEIAKTLKTINKGKSVLYSHTPFLKSGLFSIIAYMKFALAVYHSDIFDLSLRHVMFPLAVEMTVVAGTSVEM